MEATYETLLVDIFIGLQLYVLQNARGERIMSKYINVDEYKRHLDMICRSGYTQQVIDIFIEWFLAIAESIATEDDAPVVHAYWKLTANKNHNICAYCGTFAPLWFDDDGEKIEWLSDYCPKCGARMDGGDL